MTEIQNIFKRFEFFVEEGIVANANCFRAKQESRTIKFRNAIHRLGEHLKINFLVGPGGCQLWINNMLLSPK
jgi:hypothetical protein